MEIFRFIVNPLQENTWVVCGPDGSCVVVDPGFLDEREKERLLSCFDEHRPAAVLLTHGHPDHVYGVAWMQQRYGVPVYMHPDDVRTLDYFNRVVKYGLPAPDRNFSVTTVTEGSEVEAAGMRFKVIGTPGHSPGSVCWLMEAEKVLFSGDTLFTGAIGRTDFIYGDYDDEIRSIMEKLMALPGDISVLPGHGPESSIAGERTGNPFLEPFNEREEIPELNEDLK